MPHDAVAFEHAELDTGRMLCLLQDWFGELRGKTPAELTVMAQEQQEQQQQAGSAMDATRDLGHAIAMANRSKAVKPWLNGFKELVVSPARYEKDRGRCAPSSHAPLSYLRPPSPPHRPPGARPPLSLTLY